MNTLRRFKALLTRQMRVSEEKAVHINRQDDRCIADYRISRMKRYAYANERRRNNIVQSVRRKGFERRLKVHSTHSTVRRIRVSCNEFEKFLVICSYLRRAGYLGFKGKEERKKEKKKKRKIVEKYGKFARRNHHGIIEN